MRSVKLLLLTLLFVAFSAQSFAQKFGDEEVAVTEQKAPKGLGDIISEGFQKYKAVTAQSNAKKEMQLQQQEMQNKLRGRKVVERQKKQGELSTEEDKAILLFYKNFKVYKDAVGQVRCDVDFVIVSSLEKMLNDISMQLVWPNKTVGLAYKKVYPQTPYEWNYTLSGDSCYEMTADPTIIINTCRAVGLSKKDCAARVVWLSAAQ